MNNPPANFRKMVAVLRNLPSEEFLLRSTRRVNVFQFKHAIIKLGKEYKMEEIKALFTYLMDEGILFRVEKVDDISAKRHLSGTDLFIWEHEDDSMVHRVLLLLAAAAIGVVALFHFFPRWHRYALYYVRYPVLGFLLFMLVAALVRLAVYTITLFLFREQCWIWPNLFADCGFFESFRPAYEWTKSEKEKEE
ncbi:hypothetical protein ECANGB1_2801 [Enterospora canceri]|uniref:Translocation protein SEC62 n=1 Tax=Enterospora canceri TaxID=1081671 RepID=A0A1Y1S4A4_9MICR|nr:hypothetical protein ECANGB1_2801 [Enterospora canceri]